MYLTGRTITVTRTGFSEPVFLCPVTTQKHLVFVTVHHGAARLQYTYDTPERLRHYPHSVAWIDHDTDKITDLFGDCLFGDVVAVRLRSFGRNSHIEMTVKPYQPQSEEECTYEQRRS